jgi:hypothetical protein
MAVGMSGPDALARLESRRGPAFAPDGGAYGTIAVVGGGCYGSYYVRQLARAREKGALRWTRLLVVDRDPSCRVAREHADVTVVVEDWTAFFDRWLGAAAAAPSPARDAIVPSPLMPHLMFDWLLRRARERWPGRDVQRAPLPEPPATPWERAGDDGTHYASYATWMCPVNCVEPAICPHTRTARDWTMPAALEALTRASSGRGRPLAGPAIFHCTHRAFGVGMFDVAEVLAADTLVRRAGTAGPAEVLVGTVSHCHGALALLALGAPIPE